MLILEMRDAETGELTIFEAVRATYDAVRPTNESLRVVRRCTDPRRDPDAEILCGRCEESIVIEKGYIYRAGPWIQDHAACGTGGGE